MPDLSELSDGHHTFSELYEHRSMLLVALLHAHPALGWRSRLHADGTGQPGWFIAGLNLPTGEITYHLAEAFWPLLDGAGIQTLDHAPPWDGHSSADVLTRLRLWLHPHA